MPTYYFDASDAAPIDPNNVWTNEVNAFDGNITTKATTGSTGSTSSNYMLAEGTNAPISSSSTIISIRARMYGDSGSVQGPVEATIYTNGLAESLGACTKSSVGTGYGNYATLSTPTGGWSWLVVSMLETKAYSTSALATPAIYIIEIEVTAEEPFTPGHFYLRQGFQ